MTTQEKPQAVIGHVSRQVVDDFESRVEGWLNRKLPELGARRITSLRSSVSGGMSGETYIVTLEGSQEAGLLPCTVVLKKDVGDNKTNPQASFDTLVKVQSVLGNIPGLRVPRVLGVEMGSELLGAPFMVMEFMEGNIPSDVPSYAASGFVRDASVEQRAKLWREGLTFLAKLHRLDVKQLGLDQVRFDAPGDDDLEKCLNYTIEMFRKEADGYGNPVCEQAVAWLLANRPSIDKRCLCWGDARIGNIIWRDFECAAVIDWEMSSIGCPGIDLGWWSFFHRWSTYGQEIPDLEGLCVGQELADLYEACGGTRIENFLYYEILGSVRGLSVWLLMYKAMSAEGKLPAMDPLGDNVHMIRVLQSLMDQTT